MRVTIVPDDRYIQIDGRGLSFDFPADANIHAIQWYGDRGTVEQKVGGSRPATLAEVQPFIDAWEAERAVVDAPKPPPPHPILDADTLADAISYAETAIDRAASAARARFISSGVGQDAVYVVKGQQAEAFAAAGFNGDPPAYIAAEAAATGVTPMVAAQTILGLRDAWNNLIGPAIESQRIGGKKLVREAATVEEVDARMRAATLALQGITP